MGDLVKSIGVAEDFTSTKAALVEKIIVIHNRPELSVTVESSVVSVQQGGSSQ